MILANRPPNLQRIYTYSTDRLKVWFRLGLVKQGAKMDVDDVFRNIQKVGCGLKAARCLPAVVQDSLFGAAGIPAHRPFLAGDFHPNFS